MKSPRADELAQAMADAWNQTFPGNKISGMTIAEMKGGFRTSPCFITTAVCESLHKPEDCYELNLLKAYRDDYLALSPDGEALIARYYDIAPTIVKRMNKEKDRKAIYRSLYENYISPCVRLIEEDRNEECRQKYSEMVEMLQTEYM